MSLDFDRTLQYSGLVHSKDEVYYPLVMALIHSESGGDPQAVSRSGAAGLMQLMPVVYETANPFDPEMNIDIGIKHLRWIQDWLHRKFPDRIPPAGVLPEGFARRVLVAAWVKGFAADRGIQDELEKYQGTDWDEFVKLFPSWSDQDKWIRKVDDRVGYWKGIKPVEYLPETMEGGGMLNAFLIIGLLVMAVSVFAELN